MNVLLAGLRAVVPAGTHTIVVMEQAGWHVACAIAVPPSPPLVPLPPPVFAGAGTTALSSTGSSGSGGT